MECDYIIIKPKLKYEDRLFGLKTKDGVLGEFKGRHPQKAAQKIATKHKMKIKQEFTIIEITSPDRTFQKNGKLREFTYQVLSKTITNVTAMDNYIKRTEYKLRRIK